MRDLFVTLVVFGFLPVALIKPHIGILVWAWLAYMNPDCARDPRRAPDLEGAKKNPLDPGNRHPPFVHWLDVPYHSGRGLSSSSVAGVG
jgi:hypothetical protein